jgi:hypothetical protein
MLRKSKVFGEYGKDEERFFFISENLMFSEMRGAGSI